mgnify:CR=1 FL=1
MIYYTKLNIDNLVNSNTMEEFIIVYTYQISTILSVNKKLPVKKNEKLS